jgi:hypothetical protein
MLSQPRVQNSRAQQRARTTSKVQQRLPNHLACLQWRCETNGFSCCVRMWQPGFPSTVDNQCSSGGTSTKRSTYSGSRTFFSRRGSKDADLSEIDMERYAQEAEL